MYSKIVRMTLLSGVIALSLRICPAAELTRPPEITVPACATPPLIDGKLDDDCWNSAVDLKPFYLFKGNGKTSEAPSVKVIHDAAWLCFAFDVRVPHAGVVQPTTFDHDGDVSADDSVEVFLDPGTQGKTYLHYMLSKANVRAERKCNPGQGAVRDIGWDMPWRSATIIRTNSFQAEIAIPLVALTQHGSLNGLTMNVCVNRILATVNFIGIPIAATRENLSWAPVRRSFHEPGSFGRVLGLESLRPGTPLLVSARNIRTGGYKVGEGGDFFYEVSGAVVNMAGCPGKILVTVNDMPGQGAPITVEYPVELQGLGSVNFSIKVPVKTLAGRTAEIQLIDPSTGEALQQVALRDMETLSLMRSYPRLSYYTSETHAEIICDLGLPEAELKNMRLVAGTGDAEFAAASAPGHRESLRIPLAELPAGRHKFLVSLQAKQGEAVVSQNVELVKRDPKPGCEWKIDHLDKVLLNNGRPFFPFGIMVSARIDAEQEIMIEDIADIGFNSVVRFGSDPRDKIGVLLDLAKKHNLYVMEWLSSWKAAAPVPWGTAAWWNWQMTNTFLPGAEKIKNHPNLAVWYLFDEPQANRDYAAWILQLHRNLYRIDGYHPTQVLYVPPVPEGAEFDNCDIFGIDPYWVPGGGVGEVGNPNVVGKQTWFLRRRADRDLKLAWVTPYAELYSGTRLRILAESEQRVQTYLALIQGAKGLLYFRYPFMHQSAADTFRKLSAEMKILGPACSLSDPPQLITYAPAGFDPVNNIFPDVQVSLKRNPGGGCILLAANWKPYPVDVEYRVSALGKTGKVARLFGDAEYKISNSAFSDSMAAMDTRAYAIDTTDNEPGPVDIRVNVSAHPEQTDPFYTRQAIPDAGIPGKKNILRNSSFEECSIPGMPDYYWDIRTPATMKAYRQGDPRGDCLWSIDDARKFDGKQSLRMTGNGFLLFGVSPEIDQATPFTFSAWVCADKGGKIAFYTGDRTIYPLSNEWQRISTAIPLPSETPYGGHLIGFTLIGANSNSTVWIDAMQFERGTNATPYER